MAERLVPTETVHEYLGLRRQPERVEVARNVHLGFLNVTDDSLVAGKWVRVRDVERFLRAHDLGGLADQFAAAARIQPSAPIQGVAV